MPWPRLERTALTGRKKCENSQKNNGTSIFSNIIEPQKEYVLLDILNMCILYFGLPGNDSTKDEETAEEVGRLRRPTSCGCFEVFNTVISFGLLRKFVFLVFQNPPPHTKKKEQKNTYIYI